MFVPPGSFLEHRVLRQHLRQLCPGNRRLAIARESSALARSAVDDGFSMAVRASATPESDFDAVALLDPTPAAHEVEEALRVTRDRGRVMFAVRSADHCRAARAKCDHRGYITTDLVRLAGDLETTVLAIVPYGLVLGDRVINHWLEGSLAHGPHWARVLSYVCADERIANFCAFLELDLVAHFPFSATGQGIAVLEKTPSIDRNSVWLADQNAYAAELAEGLTLATVARRAQFDAEQWRERLETHLHFAPNRLLLVRLLTALLGRSWPLDLDSFMGPLRAREQRHYNAAAALDRDLVAFLETWFGETPLRELLTYSGLCIGGDLQYELAEDILNRALDAFSPGELVDEGAWALGLREENS